MKDIRYILSKPNIQEEVPTNTTGSAVFGTSPDEVFKKPKKRKTFTEIAKGIYRMKDPREDNNFSILMSKAEKENVQKLSDLLRIVKDVFELVDDFDWVIFPGKIQFKPKNKDDLDILVRNRHTIRKFLEEYV